MSLSWLVPVIGILCFAVLLAAAGGAVWFLWVLLSDSLRNLWDDLHLSRVHLPHRRTVATPAAPPPIAARTQDVAPTALTDSSTEAMWHRMQGTSQRRRRLR